MTSNIEKLKEIIDGSDLPLSDKENMLMVFTSAPDEELGQVVELFGEDPAMIKKMSDNLKQKQQALQDGDKAAWTRIVDEEAKWIAGLGE